MITKTMYALLGLCVIEETKPLSNEYLVQVETRVA